MKVKLIAKFPAIQVSKMFEVPDGLRANQIEKTAEYQKLITEHLVPKLMKKLEK